MPPLAAGCQAATASINRHHLQLNTCRAAGENIKRPTSMVRTAHKTTNEGLLLDFLGVSVTGLF